MNETTKTKKLWSDKHRVIFQGNGIDIGCGPDPIFPDVRPFDVEHGDANHITAYVQEQFDFVFSSHCLEHMHDPHRTIQEWFKLVKPGGYMLFIVPDEDLYEQGIFPSIFNTDHKATFTIKKHKSWSPVSVNVLDLVHSLDDGELVEIVLHDVNYDRRRLRHGSVFKRDGFVVGLLSGLYKMLQPSSRTLVPSVSERIFIRLNRYVMHDQTFNGDALAQIQCIVRKRV